MRTFANDAQRHDHDDDSTVRSFRSACSSGISGWMCLEMISAQGNCTDFEVCVDDPDDRCFGCDCPVVCRAATALCGGIGGLECPSGLKCIPDPECNPAEVTDCLGLCVAPSEQLTICGGFRQGQCPLGEDCYDIPTDLCDPFTSTLRPCRGFCAQEVGAPCGGFAGILCGPGLVCVDPLFDGCDNRCGGADCGGICVPESQ